MRLTHAFIHMTYLLKEMQSQVNNLNTTFKRLEPNQTAEEISTDISKDTALQYFAAMLTETNKKNFDYKV